MFVIVLLIRYGDILYCWNTFFALDINNIQFIILDKSPCDIIIGLEAIRNYDLTTHLSTYFKAQENALRKETPELNTLSSGSAGNSVATDSEARPTPVPTQTGDATPLKRANSTIHVYPKDLFLDPAEDADYIEVLMEGNPWSQNFNESIKDQPSTDYPQGKSEEEPKWEFQIEGSEADKETLRKLLEENRDIFATTVKATPAKVTPFSFEVDEEGWNVEKANKARARLNSVAKEVTIEKFLKKARVIAPSDAPAWSQVLLTPKPNGSWRFCLDYRMLNKYTRRNGWPIPNILDVLAKIGSCNPKFFAKMDCTAGYHQVAMAEACQKYTTFTTKFGNYKWLRTPMGPSNAPSMYQKAMMTEIFPQQIHQILEVYLDDIITWAQTIDELVSNLRIIFGRLRSMNITLNPEKCVFGLTEVEYVGHLIMSMVSPSQLTKRNTSQTL